MSRLSRSRWAAVGAAVAVALGAGALSIASGAGTPSSFVPIDAERILDTRTGVGLSGPFVSPVGRTLQVTGSVATSSGSAVVVPTGATAVVLTVTVVKPLAGGFVSVRANGASGPPLTSNVNFSAGDITANAVTVALAAGGAIDIVYDAYGAVGPMTDMLVDVTGYYVAGSSGPPGPPGPQGPSGPPAEIAYGYVFSQITQFVPVDDAVLFDIVGALSGVTYAPGTGQLTVTTNGTYRIEFMVAGVEPNQFALFVNGIELAGSRYASASGTQQNNGHAIATLVAGDAITLVNSGSPTTVSLFSPVGGTGVNVNASILIEQLA